MFELQEIWKMKERLSIKTLVPENFTGQRKMANQCNEAFDVVLDVNR